MLFLSYHQKKKESLGIIIHGPTVSSLPYVIRVFGFGPGLLSSGMTSII